jgi:general secretion pathway protein I
VCDRPAEPSVPRRDRGFTLIETLVALAILAMVSGFAFRVFSGALLSLSGSQHEQMALIVAESMLDRVGRDIELRDGNLAGQTSDGFRWTLWMAPYRGAGECPPRAACGAVPHGIVVQVNVGWTEQRRARQVQLSTLRLAEPAIR